MRNLLAALSLLVAVVTLYQGLVLRGLIDGPAKPLDAEAATFLLAAAGAMVLAGVMLRWSAGIAAVEMALAGIAVISIGIADPPHRYLTAYGGVAVALALAAMAVELRPPVTRSALRASTPPVRARQRTRIADNDQSFVRLQRVQVQHLPPEWREHVPPWPTSGHVVPRIDAARARQETERRRWRAWCAAHRPGQGRPTAAPAAVERARPGVWAEVDEQHEETPGTR